MRQNRFQKGSLRPRKRGRCKVWVAQSWEAGTRRSKVLGKCAEIPKTEAELMLATILQPVNSDAGHHQTPLFMFEVYVREVFLPAYRKKWKESTRMTSGSDIERYLVPAFSGEQLSRITRSQMQRFNLTNGQPPTGKHCWTPAVALERHLPDGAERWCCPL